MLVFLFSVMVVFAASSQQIGDDKAEIKCLKTDSCARR